MVLEYQETMMYAGPCCAVRTQLELVELQGVDLLRSVFQIRHGPVIEESFSTNGEQQTGIDGKWFGSVDERRLTTPDHLTQRVGAEFLIPEHESLLDQF